MFWCHAILLRIFICGALHSSSSSNVHLQSWKNNLCIISKCAFKEETKKIIK